MGCGRAARSRDTNTLDSVESEMTCNDVFISGKSEQINHQPILRKIMGNIKFD